jgi:hypothetical protein
MNGQAASALPATPETSLTLVGPAAQTKARAALKRFEEAVQSLLDTPLDEGRVQEWTTLRAIATA